MSQTLIEMLRGRVGSEFDNEATFTADEVAQIVAALSPAPQMAVTYDHIERLQHAVEGECDGLMIDGGQALAILSYVFHEAPSNPPTDQMVGDEPSPIDAYKAENAKHGWSGRNFGMQGAHLSLDRNGNAMILFKEEDLQYDESGPYIALSASETVELRDYLVDAFPSALSAPEAEG